MVARTPEETEAEGRRLGKLMREGRIPRTVLLYGDLGAGKTTLIKGIASAFGIPGRDIGSASFVIVAEYDTSPRFYHIDLYRIETREGLDELGIWEYMESGGIAVVEWAERLREIPEGAITVRMNYLDEGTREIIIEGEGPGGGE
ncbi:MAG TPA: tRNA (adenosine(37)-N6)-threonylcarbamoyltransferase complex ATPase subunit type 1 TsaE [Dissulfurispiraceae bacterium]